MNKFVLAGIFLGISTLAFADVPVVDYSADSSSSAVAQPMDEQAPIENSAPSDQAVQSQPAKQNLSPEQRLNKVEAQVDNLNRQNLSSKLGELQDRVQQISGKLDEQSHQIEQLSNQTKNYYQDLNQRMEKGKPTVGAVTEPTIPAVATPAVTATKPAKATATTGAVKKTSQAAIDAANLKEQQLYQTAIDLLPDKKYDESSKKLNDYLRKYPKGAYVSNAHYWLGEIAFLQKNYLQAETEFKIVVDKYSDSKKVSDALLKLALVHYNQSKHDQAREELKQVMKKYPNTTAAQLAKQQLETN